MSAIRLRRLSKVFLFEWYDGCPVQPRSRSTLRPINGVLSPASLPKIKTACFREPSRVPTHRTGSVYLLTTPTMYWTSPCSPPRRRWGRQLTWPTKQSRRGQRQSRRQGQLWLLPLEDAGAMRGVAVSKIVVKSGEEEWGRRQGRRSASARIHTSAPTPLAGERGAWRR